MRGTRGSAPLMLGGGRDPVVHRPARTRASTIGRGEARGPRPVEAGIVRPEPRSRDDGAVNRRGKLVALHHQVFLTIRNEVVSGRYHGDGSPQALPGEHELASRFRVSRATVRRALASLESDGLVVRRHGVGTFAAPAPGHVSRARPVEDVFDGAQELVDGYEREVIEFREVEPPHFLLEIFPGIGSPCIYLCMLARRDGEAVHLMHQYVPRHQAARVQEARRARVSMLTLLRRHGVATHSLELNISAAGADLHAATHMAIPVGTPILVTRRVSAGTDGQPIECFWSLSRPEKHSYTFRFDDVAPARPG